MHITEEEWEKMDIKQQTKHETKIPQELTQIRAEANLTKIMQKTPQTKAWLTQDYTDREVKRQS